MWKGSSFFPPPPILVFGFLIMTIPVGIKWYLTAALFPFPLHVCVGSLSILFEEIPIEVLCSFLVVVGTIPLFT